MEPMSQTLAEHAVRSDRWVWWTSSVVILGFIGVNIFIGCNNPGWECRYGWPFTFYHWSDAIAGFNGSTAPQFLITPLLADVVIGLGTAFGCGWLARRVTRNRAR